MVPWNLWSNALLFVATVVIMQLIAFGLVQLVHAIKLCGDKPTVWFEEMQAEAQGKKVQAAATSNVESEALAADDDFVK